jgi:hypothetical protein
MRNILCKTLILIIVFFLNGSFAFGGELGGSVSTRKNISESFKDGEKQSTSESLANNLKLGFTKSITPMISYKINFWADWKDAETTNAEGTTVNAYRRSVSPAISFSLGNRMYGLGAGYTRADSWSTSDLSEESRTANEHYYSNFGLRTRNLPSLSMRASRRVPNTKKELTDDIYSINSTYTLPSKDIRLSYSANISRSELNDPSSVLERRVSDNFRSGYQIGYNNNLFGGNVNYSISYQGSFSRNKTRQFTAQSGSLSFQRAPTGGLHAIGSSGSGNENVNEELPSEPLLVDEDFDSSTGIDLENDQFNNIGIWISSGKTVDKLYVYVNENVAGDLLDDATQWKAYKSDFNQDGTWSEFLIAAVSVSAVDVIENIYRYEITFASEQTASFFKVVNMVTSDVLGVFVTEIEAYGTDVIPDTNVLESISTNFSQGIDFGTTIYALSTVTISLSYSLDRRDNNPVSLTDSFAGIITNLYSDEITGEKEDFSSKASRSYGISTNWLAHELLTATVGFNQNEDFDDKNSRNVRSNTYSLSLNSSPLPTLSTGFILNRNENFEFDKKRSISDTMFISIGSALYKDINMNSSLGFTRSEDLFESTEISAYFLSGSISAIVTKKLSGSLGYNVNWSDGVTTSKEFNTGFSYRPARKVNFSGNFRISSADDNVSMSEGITMGWLPLPVLRISSNWQRKESDPGPVITDRISFDGTWYLTKFANLRFSYFYSRNVRTSKIESHNFRTNLNCGF